MGCFAGRGCGVFNTQQSQKTPSAPNPINFRILELIQVGDNVVAKIQYPDCTNFEGIKICVFKNTTTDDIKNRNIIDPHFADNPNAPVARFTPTIEGVLMAVNFAKYI